MPFKTPSGESAYIREHLMRETDPVLKEMLAFADEHYVPVLLPESAAFLRQIVMLTRPEKTLEIGTAIGYSTQLILRSGGKHVYTIEIKEELIERAKCYLDRAWLLPRVTFFAGDASEILPMAMGQYDFVFMDGPKTRYIEFLPHIMRMLKPGGVLLCDNVLWNGMVTGERETQKSKSTIVHGLDAFLTAICSDPELTTSILPVGDGMSLSIRRR